MYCFIYLVTVIYFLQNGVLAEGEPYYVWLGGNDLENEGDWRWSSDNSVINSHPYTRWYPGVGQGEVNVENNCMPFDERLESLWTSLPCGLLYKVNKFVCQWEK